MIKMTDDEAILHLTYITIPKVYNKTEKDKVALKMATDALDRPLPNKGEWIEKTGEGFDAWAECSECGCVNPFEDDFNYCPNCGADMREVE